MYISEALEDFLESLEVEGGRSKKTVENGGEQEENERTWPFAQGEEEGEGRGEEGRGEEEEDLLFFSSSYSV